VPHTPRPLRVCVFRNLHLPGVFWSVRDNASGRTIGHATQVIVGNAEFVVQPAGHKKAWEFGKRTVHAWVKGDLIVDPWEIDVFRAAPGRRVFVTYNPKAGIESFFAVKTKRPVEKAKFAYLHSINEKSTVLTVDAKYRSA
jgi:hypothetical protein